MFLSPFVLINPKIRHMKRTFILTSIAAITATVILVSCGPSRVYSNQGRPSPPPSHSYFSLIISPTPGFAMSRYPDGRYYHRSPQGFIYWKGYDNRFYLDRSHLNRVRYSQSEYNQWKRYNKSSRNNRGGRRY